MARIEDLEKLYSPSQWSPRLGANVIVQDHVKITSEESKRVRGSIPFKTFSYGPSDNEKLDIFQPENSSSSNILVYFSGGYWQELSGEISAYPVAPFYQHDICVIVVHYDRAPKGQ